MKQAIAATVIVVVVVEASVGKVDSI